MKVKHLLLFSSLFTLMINLARAAETEPNNSATTANTLTLNGSNNGSIAASDEDWYKITLTGDGALQLNLTSNEFYTSCKLYDNDGVTQLNYVEAANGTATVTTDGLAAGTYYLKIYAYYDGQTPTYSISNTLTTPSPANDTEPDSTRALALTLPLNGSLSGHAGYYYNNHRDSVDWYKITTTGDGLLKLFLTSVNNNFASCQLYDNNGTTELNYVEVKNGTNTVSTDGLAAGTYYLKIYPYYNNQFVPYTIADSLFTPSLANDAEPDSTRALALTLPLNGSLSGHAGYYYNNHRDSADWYKIIVANDGFVKITLTSANSNYVSCRLYDNDGTTELKYIEVANGTNTGSVDGLAAGTYYLKINPYYNNQFASYLIADSLFTYNQNDTLPNNYFKQAHTLLANRTETGHTGFHYNLARDSADIWKINYTGTSGALNITFNLLPHISDNSINYMWLQVFKDTAAAPVYSNNFNVSSTTIALTGLVQGYYYIKIYPYYNNQFNAYSVTNTFTQVAVAALTVKSKISPNTCGSNSITFNVTGSKSPYRVFLYRNSIKYDSVSVATDTVRFGNLPAGNYYATAYGDGATDAAFGTSAAVQFLPPYPTTLTVTNIGATGAQLTWSTLSCASYFSIQYKISGAANWTTLSTNGNTSGYPLTGLTPDTKYVWQIASADTTNATTLTSPYSVTDTFMTMNVLPVTLIDFKAVPVNDNVEVSWQTATETNNTHFVILRSADGNNYNTIGNVMAIGSSTATHQYSFIDNSPIPGTAYYRLRQIDNDGHYTDSKTVIVLFAGASRLMLYPNPAVNVVFVRLSATGRATLHVYDMNGKRIMQKAVGSGTTKQQVDVSSLAVGIYTIVLQQGEQKQTARFEKR